MQGLANTIQGPLSSWSRSTRNDHYRQLPHILHLPPPTRRSDKQLVFRRPRQRAPGSNTRPRRPGREPGPRRKSGARCSIMTLIHYTHLIASIYQHQRASRTGLEILRGRNRLHRLLTTLL